MLVYILYLFPFREGKLAEKLFEFVELCKYLQKQQFIWGDYIELVNLLLLYLTGDNEQGSNMLNRPGALHRARWMSKMIYCLRIDLLSNKIIEDLPKGSVYASGQQQKIKSFVQFFIFCYTSWWLTSPIPASAPLNDLMLINNLNKMRSVPMQHYMHFRAICGPWQRN